MAGVKRSLLVAVLLTANRAIWFAVRWSLGGRRSSEASTSTSASHTCRSVMMAESVFQMIAHAIEGAVAGAMYKAEVAPKTEAARAR
jgi:hypothetical protein